VFDADSVMRGETLVDLVKLMEAHPQVGLIQTVPALVNAASLVRAHAAILQPALRADLHHRAEFWAQAFGNYWGHNAIIRTEPFMQHCDLPQLPGRKPFGGQILSHDFVEAALLLKANWEVWLAYDLEGSYEEAPQTMIENAQRDRRWCQGNMQHFMVVWARGLRGGSRLHLARASWAIWPARFGCFFCSRLTGCSGTRRTPACPKSPCALHAVSQSQRHPACLPHFCHLHGVLFLPKVLALVDLALDRERRKAFGGI
jgi:membrane glycosyltransferase